MHVPTYGVSKTSTFPKRRLELHWWAGALMLAATTVIGRLVSGSPKKNKALYNKKEQAPWAPPGWVFAPAWSINNIFLIRALLQLINERYRDDRAKQLLALQGGIWLVFCTFGYVYFRKKSPMLAAIWTQADAVLALASLLIALKKDKKLAANYYPLTGWSWFASSVAWYQVAKNGDKVLQLDAVA